MLITGTQNKKLKQIFNMLPAQTMGHSMRTGLLLQTFTEDLIETAPVLIGGTSGSIGATDMIFCAREFGFYHHLGDVTLPGRDEDASAVRDMISSVFDGAWNSGGYYMTSLLQTIETNCLRWDGKDGGMEKGKKIPFWGRACAVAGTFDELCFKGAYTPRKAMKRLAELSGSVLDPELVTAFIKCYPAVRSLEQRPACRRSS